MVYIETKTVLTQTALQPYPYSARLEYGSDGTAKIPREGSIDKNKLEEIMEQLIVTSPAFKNEAVIPIQYTGRGADISPELHLSPIDENVKSLAIIMDDLSHLIPEFNHWVIWNIPVMQTIPESIPHGAHVLNGAVQGRGYGKNRYRGPKPPFHQSHRYRFSVYALDALLRLPDTTRKRDLLKSIQGHVLQEGCLIGRFR